MNILEYIRYFILGDPLKININNPLILQLLSYIFNNNIFLGLIIIVLLNTLINLVIFISHTTHRSNNYYFYLAGSFLIFTALNYKYSFEVIENTTETNLNAVKYTTNKLMEFIGLVDKYVENRFSDISHLKLLTENNQFLKKSAFNKYPSTSHQQQNPTTSIQHISKTKEHDTTLSNNIFINPNNNTPLKIIDKNEQYNTESYEIKNTIPTKSVYIKMNNDENDFYIKKITQYVSDELITNTKLNNLISKMDDLFIQLKLQFEAFTTTFKNWNYETNKIKNEMKGFNVDIENLDFIVKEMSIDVEFILNIKKVIKKITDNFKMDNKYNIDCIKTKTPNKLPLNKAYSRPSVSIVFLTVYFLCHTFLALYFIISVIYESIFVFGLRLILFICFAIDVFFGLYMLVYAQALDKVCIIGNIEGCKSTFTDGFAEFALKTGLNLKNKNHYQKEKLYQDIDKLQIQAHDITTNLKSFLVQNPIDKFRLKTIIFFSIFNKIEFVKEDFENLTNHKVSKERFFNMIGKMKTNLTNINLMLEVQFNITSIIEIYDKEVAFLYFIQNEKMKLYEHIDNQITKPIPNHNIPINTGICEWKKRRICKLKFIADCVAFSLIIGGSIFMILIVI